MIIRAWNWTLVQLRMLTRDEHGANMVEYALLIAFAILVILVALNNFSNAFVNATNFIANQLDNAVNPT